MSKNFIMISTMALACLLVVSSVASSAVGPSQQIVVRPEKKSAPYENDFIVQGIDSSIADSTVETSPATETPSDVSSTAIDAGSSSSDGSSHPSSEQQTNSGVSENSSGPTVPAVETTEAPSSGETGTGPTDEPGISTTPEPDSAASISIALPLLVLPLLAGRFQLL